MKNSVKLAVPYKSQLDNALNPGGACNVTSIAMCLEYLGVTPLRQNIQIEDELYAYMESRNLNRHSPRDLATVVRNYGIRSISRGSRGKKVSRVNKVS
ncbi:MULTISPECIES: C39 family peptidase [unclassified Microcoleus]|uniref:C39 family peptidase n=1 Tax=unclassified Microcoleus TaxID=2642155 RepID=UPI002FD08DF8